MKKNYRRQLRKRTKLTTVLPVLFLIFPWTRCLHPRSRENDRRQIGGRKLEAANTCGTRTSCRAHIHPNRFSLFLHLPDALRISSFSFGESYRAAAAAWRDSSFLSTRYAQRQDCGNPFCCHTHEILYAKDRPCDSSEISAGDTQGYIHTSCRDAAVADCISESRIQTGFFLLLTLALISWWGFYKPGLSSAMWIAKILSTL